jgi:hypothetical protein
MYIYCAIHVARVNICGNIQMFGVGEVLIVVDQLDSLYLLVRCWGGGTELHLIHTSVYLHSILT